MDFKDDLVHPTAAALGVVRTQRAFWMGLELHNQELLFAPFSQPERPQRHPDLHYSGRMNTSSGLRQDVDGSYWLNDKQVEHPHRHEVVGYFNPHPGEPTIQIHAFDRNTGDFIRRL